MKKDAIVLLEDILKNIALIERFTHGLSEERFMGDTKTQYSVMRGIEIIGEATKNLPDGLKRTHSDVPWKDIAGMRDKLIHAYFGVNAERVWLVVKDDLPVLKRKIQNMMSGFEKEE
jgi:uncharacterized protein with HEPN domain